MPNVENATKPSITESGQKKQNILQDSEFTEQDLNEILDPTRELYHGPDNIADVEERNAEIEAQIEELNYTKDILYHSILLDLSKKNSTINISKIKSMVCLDPKIVGIEKQLLTARKTQRAIKVLLNKYNNRFISARKLFFQQ